MRIDTSFLLKTVSYPSLPDRKRWLEISPAGNEARTEGRWPMPLLWLLVILLIIFAIVGGVAISNFLWLVLIIALVVAVLAML
jgi:hypothetical protein